LIGITRDGQWFYYEGETSAILDDTWSFHPSCKAAMLSPDPTIHGIYIQDPTQDSATNQAKVAAWRSVFLDAAFPVLHGKNGEDGTIQGYLKLAGIPCVGCGLLSSAICMDKDIAHRLVAAQGIRVPASLVLTVDTAQNAWREAVTDLSYPVFVKPANAGSSYGITKVMSEDGIEEALRVAFTYDKKIVIEEAIDGFEVGCAVMGTRELTIGEVDEIELTGGFFDYTEKYSLITSKIHMPARIDEEIAARIKQTAAIIYKTLSCSGFARVDMFLTPAKDIVFNEVNTIPGFTSHSRFPNMLKGIGLSFTQIVAKLLEDAL
jgi:D-alanine---D-serine ligase